MFKPKGLILPHVFHTFQNYFVLVQATQLDSYDLTVEFVASVCIKTTKNGVDGFGNFLPYGTQCFDQ